jgi:hypothetical protein
MFGGIDDYLADPASRGHGAQFGPGHVGLRGNQVKAGIAVFKNGHLEIRPRYFRFKTAWKGRAKRAIVPGRMQNPVHAVRGYDHPLLPEGVPS